MLTCGSTTRRKAWRRDAPSVIALISMSHGTASKKPFMTKIEKGSSIGDEHEDDAEERVQQPDPVEHQEDRDDQRQHRKGMQHEQRPQERVAAAESEAREVVAGERRDDEDDRGLRQREHERVAERRPDAGNWPPAVALERTTSAMSGSTGSGSWRNADLVADERCEQSPRPRPASTRPVERTHRGDGAIEVHDARSAPPERSPRRRSTGPRSTPPVRAEKAIVTSQK